MSDQIRAPRSCYAGLRRASDLFSEVPSTKVAGLLACLLVSTVMMPGCSDDGATQNEGGTSDSAGTTQTSGSTGSSTGTWGGTESGSESGTVGEDGTRLGWALDPDQGRRSMTVQHLTNNEAWVPLAAEYDPELDHRPGVVECPRGAWNVEADGLEVDTGKCNYFAMYQPLAQPLFAGQVLRALLWHDRLVAQEPAEAHVVLRIGGQLVFEKIIGIPSQPDAHDMYFVVPHDIAMGTQVDLHLHNHGYNTWNLLALQARQPN